MDLYLQPHSQIVLQEDLNSPQFRQANSAYMSACVCVIYTGGWRGRAAPLDPEEEAMP